MEKGLLITLEGGEGCGKSTQAVNIKNWLMSHGYPVLFAIEPGETAIGEVIRELVLSKKNTEMDIVSEVFLYMAARAQLTKEMIQPALAKGEAVLLDRHIDSSMAYQGYARGLGFELVNQLNQIATRGRKPDITFYFDLDPIIGLKRKNLASKGNMDRLESESLIFHQKVREGYLKLAEMEKDRIKIIDASQNPAQVWNQIELILKQSLS